MRALVMLLMVSVSTAQAGEPKELRYLRLAGDEWVPESTLSRKRDKGESVYVSVTDRGTEKMTLTLRHDGKGQLLAAEARQQIGKSKKTASLTMQGKWAILKREGGITEQFMLPTNPVVTTAPDWSDILEVLRRYDRGRGGKQEFPGFWIHPVQPPRVLTFTVEKLGEDSLVAKERKVSLGRYRVVLRSGGYLVWADAVGLVYKLMPVDRPAGAVVLEGFEEASGALK
ncbi:MAG TPA: hypothetical protein VEL76_17110 [Gemmataceae bacterium]|nr:hypothetical protein [Gemmataceae bacterium]